MNAASRRAYNKVAERSGGVCEGCGKLPATNMHHRLYRGRGGKDEVVNLLHLCGMGNVNGCHGRAHTGEGEHLGWSCPTSVDPSDQPANKPTNYRGRVVFLLPDGRIEHVIDPVF